MMDFTSFLDLIPKITAAALPGEQAHAIMSPPERRAVLDKIDFAEKKPKLSAVLILIYPRHDKAMIVLTLRNTYAGVHSAQISFPGGRHEPPESFLDTALRETFEEVGIAADTLNVVREFSPIYIPPSNFLVYPFLAFCKGEPIFTPDPHEVSGIIEMPLDHFLDDANIFIQKRSTSYSQSIDVKGFVIGDHYIWGATAMMLSELKEVLKKAL